MTITIDETEYDVTEFNAKREVRQTNIKYNTRGDMLIDMVSRKYLLEATLGLLNEEKLGALRKSSEKIFVPVKFNAPEGEVTEEFFISDEPAPVVTVINGERLYSVKLTLKQR